MHVRRMRRQGSMALKLLIVLAILGGGIWLVYALGYNDDIEGKIDEIRSKADIENFVVRSRQNLKDLDEKITYAKARRDGSFEATSMDNYGLRQKAAIYKDRTDKAQGKLEQAKGLVRDLVEAIKEEESDQLDGPSSFDDIPDPPASFSWKGKEYDSASARQQVQAISNEVVELTKEASHNEKMATAYEQGVRRLDKAIKEAETKRKELAETIAHIEAELEIADVEGEINSIVSTIKGESDDNRLGQLIRNAQQYISAVKPLISEMSTDGAPRSVDEIVGSSGSDTDTDAFISSLWNE